MSQPVFIPSVIGAVAAIWALVQGYLQYYVSYHLVTTAVVLTAAVVIQMRIKASGAAFAAGLGLTSLLAIPVLIGRLSGWIKAGESLSGYPWLVTAIIVSHTAWLVAGIAGVALLIRAGDSVVRRPATARTAVLIGLGALSALLILAVLLLIGRQTGDRFNYFVVLTVVAAEFAIAGPLIASRMRESRAFLGGWVLGAVVAWVGLFNGRRAFREPEMPETVVGALVVVWLVLGAVGLLRDHAGSTGHPIPAWLVGGLLVVPVGLAAVPVGFVPKAQVAPVALGMVVSPGNDVLYVADFANDRILKLNTTTQEQLGEALPVGDQPTQLALTPDGSRLYVASSGANTVTAIDVAAWKVSGTPVAVAPGPIGLALHAATHRLLVLCRKSAAITVINTVTMKTVGGPIGTGAEPSDVEVTPDGSRILVARSSDQSVAVIDPETREQVRSPIALGFSSADLVAGSNGLVYVVGGSEYAVIDLRKNTPPERIPLPGSGRVGTLDADGKRLFVLGAVGDQVSLIMMDVGTKTVAGKSEIGDSAAVSLTTSADGQRVYVSRPRDSSVLVFDTIGPKLVRAITLKN